MTLRALFKSVSGGEWKLVIILCLAMLAVSFGPLLYGYLITPAGQVFTGIHFSAPSDWFVYYSYLEQARQGQILFYDLFTGEPHLSFLNIFWLGAGLAGKIFHIQNNIFAFNWLKIFFTPLFFLTAYLLIAYLLPEIRQRKIAICLLTFGSGLGVFLLDRVVRFPYNFAAGRLNWPMDLWVPEGNTFLTLYYSPHFIFSVTLILAVFLFTLLFVENQKSVYSLAAGLSGGLLIAFHPFHLPIIFGVTGVYFMALVAIERRPWRPLIRHYTWLIFLSLPAAAYYVYLLKFDYVTQQRAMQNDCFTTPLWLTLFSYGGLLVLALGGLWVIGRQKKALSGKRIFVVVWAVVGFALIYFPVNWQRRMTEGLQFPLVILAVIALSSLAAYVAPRQDRRAEKIYQNREWLVILGLVLLVSSNLFALAADVSIYQRASTISYLEADQVAAASWLKAIPAEAVVLATADDIVSFIPAYSGRRVYVGHGVETVDWRQKQDEVKWFFAANRPQATERNFLLSRNISYIFYGAWESRLGDYQPAGKSYLTEVYANDGVKIYQVK